MPTTVVDLPGKQGVLGMPALALREARRLRPEGIAFIHANQAKAALLGTLFKRRMGVPLLWMKHDHVFDGRVPRARVRLRPRGLRVAGHDRAVRAPVGRAREGRLSRRGHPGPGEPVPSAPHVRWAG